MKMKEKNLILSLVEDLKNRNSELWEMDYGCDGSDECCGNCGGDELVDYKLLMRLEEIIKVSKKE